MKKIGLMGCGLVADYGHLPAIASVPELELYALFDPDAQRLDKAQKKYNARHKFTQPQDFYRCGLDAIVVTSPAPAHEANVLGAAAHGLPVLCEKPLAMNDTQARRMIDAMGEAGVPLHVAFCYRFSLAAMRIKQLVSEAAIGEVRSMRLVYNWDCHGKWIGRDPDRAEPDPRRHGRMIEGGPMVDCGVHQIDLAQWWIGSSIARYAGHAAWVDTDYNAPDHVFAHLDHDNGCHTLVEMSYSYGHTMRDRLNWFTYELIGTRGVILYDRNNARFELRNERGTFLQEFHQEKNFRGVYEHLAHFLNTGDPGELCAAEDALHSTRIARTITEEAIEQRKAPIACR